MSRSIDIATLAVVLREHVLFSGQTDPERPPEVYAAASTRLYSLGRSATHLAELECNGPSDPEKNDRKRDLIYGHVASALEGCGIYVSNTLGLGDPRFIRVSVSGLPGYCLRLIGLKGRNGDVYNTLGGAEDGWGIG